MMMDTTAGTHLFFDITGCVVKKAANPDVRQMFSS